LSPPAASAMTPSLGPWSRRPAQNTIGSAQQAAPKATASARPPPGCREPRRPSAGVNLASARRPLRVRRPSAERPLKLDHRIPSAHIGRQFEFITCTVGDTTHSKCNCLLVYLYKHRKRCQSRTPPLVQPTMARRPVVDRQVVIRQQRRAPYPPAMHPRLNKRCRSVVCQRNHGAFLLNGELIRFVE